MVNRLLKNLYTQSFFYLSGLLVNCANMQGVCIKSRACPYDRVIPGDDKCFAYSNNFLCCQVARVRMPLDIFDVI